MDRRDTDIEIEISQEVIERHRPDQPWSLHLLDISQGYENFPFFAVELEIIVL